MAIKNASLRGEEPRRAMIAYEALEKSDYLKLTTYGIPYYNKPPLYFWVLAKSFQFGGFSKLSLRAPGLISIFLSALILFWCLRDKPWVHRVLALVFYLSLFDFLFYQSVYTGELDHFFSMLVFLSFFFQYRWLKKDRTIYFLLAAAVCFLAFITKGLPAIVFFYGGCIAIALMHIRNKTMNWIRMGRDLLLASLVLFGLISLFFHTYGQSGGNQQVLFLNLIAETKDKSVDAFNWMEWFGHLLAYPLEFFKYFLPWVLLLPVLGWRKIRDQVKIDSLTEFSLYFLVINMMPYWLSSGSKGRYVLALLPVGIIFITNVLSPLISYAKHDRPIFKRVLVILQALVYGLLVIALGYMVIEWDRVFIPTILALLVLGIVGFIKSYSLKEMKITDLLLSIALSFFLFKIVFAETILTNKLNSESDREEVASNLIQISGEKPIYLTGDLKSKEVSISVPGIQIKDDLYYPVVPSFEIPYFYALEKDQSIQYKQFNEDSDNLFLLPEMEYQKAEMRVRTDSLYSFLDEWTKVRFYLVQNKKGE